MAAGRAAGTAMGELLRTVVGCLARA
jgi:hypothetical protein